MPNPDHDHNSLPRYFHFASALMLAGAALIIPAAAMAQSEGDAIVVRAERPETTSGLDRKIYRVELDVQSITGSAAEVLNKVPSVDVDSDGKVSLRGDSSVTILIDGRPSTQSGGDSGLAQIPARDIEKVEVITNPPAEFRASGSGGVINIITRKSRKPGLTGSAQASAGEHQRAQFGLSATYNKGGLKLSGSLNTKQDTRSMRGEQDRRILDPATIAFVRNAQNSRNTNRRINTSAKFGADYTFENGESIALSVSHGERRGDRESIQQSSVLDAAGALVKDSTRRGRGKDWRLDAAESLRYERTLFKNDDKLTFNLQQSTLRQRDRFRYVTTYSTPIQAPLTEQLFQTSDYVKTDFSTDYELPLDGATIKLGYDLEHNSNRYLYSGGAVDPALGIAVITPANSNDFRYDLTIHSGYGSYQTKAWGLDMQAGLRVEQTSEETRLIAGDIANERDSLRAYPSLHLSKDLSDTAKISASFSRRVTRPEPEDLNPFADRRDGRNLRAGNPDLKPKDTQSFELGYEHDQKDFGYRLTAYYRINRDSPTDITQILADDVVLTTKANLAKDQAGGVEFGLNGKLLKSLSYNINGNVYYNEVDTTASGGTGVRSNVSATGKINLDYKPTRQDTFQLSTNYSGERLTAQGAILPMTVVNVGYKHQFDDALSGVVTVTDLFQGQKMRRRFDTLTLQDDFERRLLGPIVYVGLVYTFGGKSKTKDTGFKYDQSEGN